MTVQDQESSLKIHSFAWVWLLSLLPFAALAVMFLLFSHNTPWMDQWEFVPFLQKFHDGALRPADFWAQHNEHRIVFPRIIMLSLAQCSHWNIYAELAVNFLLGTGIFLLLTPPLARTARTIPWTVPLASLLLFSLSQWQNWFLGWQLQVFLSLFMVILSLVLINRPGMNYGSFIAATLAAIIATFSFANGMLVWPLGHILMVRTNNKNPWMIVWPITALTAVTAYFINYHAPAYHPSLLATFQTPGNLLFYIPAYLGQPIISFWGPGAVLAGAVGVLTWAFLSHGVFREKDAVIPMNFSFAPMFFVTLGLYAIASAIITAFARAGLGTEQAMSSRYTTLANPLWISILALASYRLQQKNLPLRKTMTTACGILLALLIAGSSLYGAYRWTERYHAHLIAREALLRGENTEALHFLYPDVPKLLERREILLQHHLSIFHGP